jgi:hypothetical protein
VQHTKTGKNIPNCHKIYKNISNGRKIDQMYIKYSNIFHCETFRNFPKLGFLVSKNIPSGIPVVQLFFKRPLFLNCCAQKLSTVIGNRVTGLGQFSPLGQLFLLDGFLKITEVAQNFWLLF